MFLKFYLTVLRVLVKCFSELTFSGKKTAKKAYFVHFWTTKKMKNEHFCLVFSVQCWVFCVLCWMIIILCLVRGCTLHTIDLDTINLSFITYKHIVYYIQTYRLLHTNISFITYKHIVYYIQTYRLYTYKPMVFIV